MPVPDIFRQGIARGWKTYDGSALEQDLTLEADVAIIGSGAGGGTTAEILSAAGFKVLIIEEGPLRTSDDFAPLRENKAYPALYQEGLGRMSKNGAVTILQGRAVGGTTTVNWTSSFRTPKPTLEHWAKEHAVAGHDEASMAPWFAKMEERLGVAKWAVPPNGNNQVIADGCDALGLKHDIIPRNVRGCWNLGYCGLGCPTNAKQSMLVTTIPATLDNNGELLYLARVNRLQIEGSRVVGLECLAMDERCVAPNGRKISVRAKHYVLSGGGINSPAVLLRSNAPDPHQLAGKRTFLHITNFSAARFAQKLDPFAGAPQSVYSDQFQWHDGAAGEMSYKIEVAPMQPVFASTLLAGVGEQAAATMAALPHINFMLALGRDGFHPDSAIGNVELRDDGSPILDYQMTDYSWDGVRRAWLSMAEIQFAAGAQQVWPVHVDAPWLSSWQEAKAAINSLPLELYRARIGSAHVMGGCGMSEDPKLGVTDSLGRHHQLENLSIHDGSLFPTSIGANPQLSIYGLTAKLASQLVERLKA
ncbi:GMC family oxidoreductase [Atopomonas sediminilitoris]|uniref:GMC family oxidoreductase n=1 Tax=Atopomonas sediminilitoris TaxID=2919919 RepID=UPI001F4DDAA0|nr:GMC family oxidoreductase [Atopomonas sediminilitoris]MCJ8170480.1 GMC family oxidoreductase [Atopomonas sediminilitoris]